MERLTLHFVPAAQEAGPVLDEVEDLAQRRWCPLPRHHVTKRLHRPQAHPTGTLTKDPNGNFLHCDSVAGSTLSGDKERQVTEGGDVLVLVRSGSRSCFMTPPSPVLKCPREVPASEDPRGPTSST